MIGADRNAFSSNLPRRTGLRPFLILRPVHRPAFLPFLPGARLDLAPRGFYPLFSKIMDLDRPRVPFWNGDTM
jgi:hypothetical protein